MHGDGGDFGGDSGSHSGDASGHVHTDAGHGHTPPHTPHTDYAPIYIDAGNDAKPRSTTTGKPQAKASKIGLMIGAGVAALGALVLYSGWKRSQEEQQENNPPVNPVIPQR